MASLFRRAGHSLRKLVLPLVGFWEVFGRLEELRGRIGSLESATSASLALLTQIQRQISQVDVTLTATSNEASSQIKARIDQIEADLAQRFDKLAGSVATTVASETDRLDGYIAYHADTLKESIVTTPGGNSTVRERIDTANTSKFILVARPPDADTVGGLDALLLTTSYDLLVPTEEAGLIAYLLRHGPEAMEPGVRAVLRDHLKPGAIAVDAGANIGIHAIAMALAVGPQGRVICFEPLPHLARAVDRTLRLNGLSGRARVQQMALADKNGEATIHRAAHGPMSSLYTLPDDCLTADAILVRTTTLDNCFLPGERVDLVKMDVEGAEPLVWRGMQRVLRENPDIEIILEWSSSHFRRTGEDPVAFMAEIRAAGFSPFVISDNGPARYLAPLHDGVDALEESNLLLTRRPIEQDVV
jgi:FkbM family methyltransferase